MTEYQLVRHNERPKDNKWVDDPAFVCDTGDGRVHKNCDKILINGTAHIVRTRERGLLPF